MQFDDGENIDNRLWHGGSSNLSIGKVVDLVTDTTKTSEPPLRMATGLPFKMC